LIGNELNIGLLSSNRKIDVKNFDFSSEINQKSFSDILGSKSEYVNKQDYKPMEKQDKFDTKTVASTMENSSRVPIKNSGEQELAETSNTSEESSNVAIESDDNFENVETSKTETETENETLETSEEKSVEEELTELIEAFLSGEIDDLESAVLSSERFNNLSGDEKNLLSEMLTKLTALILGSSEIKDIDFSDMKNLQDLMDALKDFSGDELGEDIKINLDDIKKFVEELQSNDSKFGEIINEKMTSEGNIAEAKVASGEVKNEASEELIKDDFDVEELTVAKSEKTQVNETAKSNEDESDEAGDNEESESEFSSLLKGMDTEEISSSKVNESADNFKIESSKIINAEMKSEAILRNSKTPFEQKIMDQIVKGTKMTFNVGKDMSEVVIKLNPKELGNVAMKISVHNETLVAEFNVDSKVVKETLESNLEDLRTALQEKGFSIEGMNVSVNQDSKNSFQEFEQMFKSQKGKKKYEEVTYVEPVETNGTIRKSLENTSSAIDAFA
jgi:flagellar hook-length control protein FliK